MNHRSGIQEDSRLAYQVEHNLAEKHVLERRDGTWVILRRQTLEGFEEIGEAVHKGTMISYEHRLICSVPTRFCSLYLQRAGHHFEDLVKPEVVAGSRLNWQLF